MNSVETRIAIEDAVREYVTLHGKAPTALLVGPDVEISRLLINIRARISTFSISDDGSANDKTERVDLPAYKWNLPGIRATSIESVTSMLRDKRYREPNITIYFDDRSFIN